MKSTLVNFLKENGIRRIQGKKVELYNFYELSYYARLVENGIEIK
jgi:hypothetical protein